MRAVTVKLASRLNAVRRVASIAAGATMLTLAASGAAHSQVSGAGAPEIQNRGVDQAVLNFLAKNNLPGATVAITRGGRLVWSKGYGKADLAANKDMHPWHRTYIGSVSKFITGVGAMKLVETGKLDLDGKVHGTGTPLWSNPLDTPGVIVNGDGALLQDATDYFNAMVQGVNNSDSNFPPSSNPAPSLATALLYHASIDRTLNAASALRVKHLLSHTSGLLRGGDTDAAAAHFKKSKDDLSFAELHMHTLLSGMPRPFEFLPEAESQYSNHGFALAGYLMGEADGTTYQKLSAREIFVPLGVQHIVAINTDNNVLDAQPYSENGNPRPLDSTDPSRLLTATGGWTATAGDLVRIMCSLDRNSNGRRVISQASVTTMETPPVSAFPSQPIGWDSIDGGVLTKDGKIDGGTALIRKYLPGSRHASDEINVAIAINKTGATPRALIDLVAGAAAVSYIPDDFDLFDPSNTCFTPPPNPIKTPTVSLIGFYPAGSSNPLPGKIEKCPATITLKGLFNDFPEGKLEYRFRFAVEGRVSTTFSTVIKGDPNHPLYEQPEVYHNVPLPLPAPSKPVGQGGVPQGPGVFAVYETPRDPLPPGPKGPKGPGGLVGQATPENFISGTVRLEALTSKGVIASRALAYRLECEPPMAILSGTVDLRDESPKAPACARPASVGASIRTNKAGPVDYVLACTGQGRTWKGKSVAKQTAPNTFIGIVVHPLQIAQKEDVICFLRRGEQFGFSDVIANDKRLYPCRVSGVTTPDPVPPPGTPGGIVSDPPRFVCIGGRTAGRAPKQVCECPRGQKQRQIAPNRFQCSAEVLCEGGRVVTRGQPPRATCECPRGLTAQRVDPPVRATKAGAPAARAKAADDDQPDRYRCVRVTTVPDSKPGTPSKPTVTCAGGVMRSNVCVCPPGTSLQTGVCRAPARAR